MKEILVWGDITPEFARLGITGECAYKGNPSVFCVSDDAFEVLCADPEENWDDTEVCWRYAPGATPTIHMNGIKRVRVAGRYMVGWKDGGRGYDSLLEYLCDCMGASTPKNVAAVTAELAQMNSMTLGALFAKYQPV